MFYSQFILAKKGPLGTIWIAAHLERKLRKNQVADTDIGVSVDSIIFPDVPIALRLSSHLLLGVVRIYSRKVNYLFDDCSEALLKIKQAFRSTAVDLPPEESTAPYHSITLPETFDLDDFELPDQQLLQGNYIDHHISNKEQITLQDTMDDVVFSTSQFGWDERFGDGNTSQMGLDLEEDLLLNKPPAAENSGDAMDLDLVQNTSGHHVESVMNANNREVTESAKLVQAKPSEPEVDNGNAEFLEYAEAPATPGLVEEPNLSNQKASASDDLVESEKHQPETITHKNPIETLHSALPGEDVVVNLGPGAINAEVKDHISTEQKSEQSISNFENSDVALGEICAVKTLSDQPCSKTRDLPENSTSLLSNGYQLDEGIMHPETSICVIVAGQVEKSPSPKNELGSGGLVSESLQVLHACNSNVSASNNLSNSKVDTCDDVPLESPTLDKSEVVQGAGAKLNELQSIILSRNLQVTDATAKSVNNMNQSADSRQLVQTNLSGSNNLTESLITKHSDEVSFPSPTSELPPPEKLLSVPEPHAELSSDLLPDTTTPAKVLSATDENGTGVTTGQKRSFTESTLTADSLHTAESSGQNRLGKTAESIPDDEDLLSSILVGRKSSILKLKPTPTQTEIVSIKRPRIASRSITYKRKVLMDDAMVLHGDTIREQLVSTEDIRRVRKKAPCTRQEIWMVQKQFLEEDIVYDPISTGMSMELVCLHNQAYELSEISLTKGDESTIPMDSTLEMQPPVDENAIPNTHDSVVEELNGESQLGTPSMQIEKQQGEADTSCVGHDTLELQKVDSAALLPFATSLEQAVASQMEVDGDSVAVVEVTEHISSDLPVESSPPGCVIPEDNAETNAECNVPLAEETNKRSEVDKEVSSLNHSSNEEVNLSNVTATNDGNGSLLHIDSETIKELSVKEIDTSERVEDIEWSGLLTAEEIRVLETFDNDGNNEAGPSLFVDHGANTEKLSPTGGHNDISYEFEERLRQANGTTDTGSAVVTEDYNGMHYMTSEHDTGFLNVDDDDLEVDESYMPSVEENRMRIIDDSGWSSRSRAVGKYLQIMFDKEAEHGKNMVPVDKLLAGKSRKEASRMFFETLVLKTRDYIEVEQRSPFNNINLRPQSMLMKSDF